LSGSSGGDRGGTPSLRNAGYLSFAPAPSVTISGSFTSAEVKPQTNPTINNLDDLLAQMRAGNTYVNIHAAAHPAGEIRGQIAPQ
jgi:CHRD domain-containing protein